MKKQFEREKQMIMSEQSSERVLSPGNFADLLNQPYNHRQSASKRKSVDIELEALDRRTIGPKILRRNQSSVLKTQMLQ